MLSQGGEEEQEADENLWLRNLKAVHFRNYAQLTLAFNARLNVIVGRNAQGKTNLLEAIYYLGTSASPRRHRDPQLLQDHQSFFVLEGEVLKEPNGQAGGVIKNIRFTYQLAASGNGRGQKKLFLDKVKQERLGEVLGQLNVVYFGPEQVNLIDGPPALRRQYLDGQICQAHPEHYYNLVRYRRVLSQRNQLLKQLRSGKGDPRHLEVWDQELIKLGQDIIVRRVKALNWLSQAACRWHQRVGGNEELRLVYRGSWGKEGEMVAASLERALAANRTRELKAGFTLVGPHIDEIAILIDGKAARSFASRGQQRTAVVALKLAEVDFLEEESQEPAVLLLDDVFSELDRERRRLLMDTLGSKNQIFITSSEELKDWHPQQASWYRVEAGQVELIS